MKVIFLDIDGVLNNKSIWQSVKDPDFQISTDMVNLVNKICDVTGAKVVISSSRRIGKPHPILWNHLKDNFGATFEIIGHTDINDKSKYAQIVNWGYNEDFEDFAIIDDEDICSKNIHFFRTDPAVGLTQEIADKIINRFNSGWEVRYEW